MDRHMFAHFLVALSFPEAMVSSPPAPIMGASSCMLKEVGLARRGENLEPMLHFLPVEARKSRNSKLLPGSSALVKSVEVLVLPQRTAYHVQQIIW